VEKEFGFTLGANRIRGRYDRVDEDLLGAITAWIDKAFGARYRTLAYRYLLGGLPRPGAELEHELMRAAKAHTGLRPPTLAARMLYGEAPLGAVDDAELRDAVVSMIFAGHETTANMIGKMVAMLLADRGRWEQLLADRALVRSAVEETLRLDANFGFGIPRYLSEPVEVGGTTLPRGATVVCSVSAANRDEQVIGDGDMDLRRSPNPHLTFGIGPHSCIGQALARTELQTALDVLLRKLPSLDLAIPADELRSREGLIVGGLEELPVRW
jgi:cytochrome P450